MRILAATDIHASRAAAKMIRDRIAEHRPDVFVAAGDLTNFGPVEFARELLAGLPVPTLAVPGNCDPRAVVPVLGELGVDLHGKKTSVMGRTFVGIGGSNPTPFGTPFELTEEEILAAVRPLMEPGVVLVSHPPPKGYVDVVGSGAHVGSVSIRAILEEFEPPLVICGHIHEARGTARHGATTIVNAGAAREGHSALISLNGNDAQVELL
jgi:Icc-related predicted phosphoesterase